MQHPKGLSLLLSLFVLSAILVSALSAGNLIFRQLKVTGTGDRGIQAFYVAESGLENALYDFRQLGITTLSVDESSAESLGRGQWWRTSSETVSSLNTTLAENEVIEVQLFKPESATEQAQSILLSWNADPSICPGADFAWVEVVQSYWNITQSQSQRSLLSSSQAGGVVVNLSGSYPYIRLRALFGDACNLNLTAYDGVDATGTAFDLPAQLQVTAIGEVVDARQALSITVPAQAPQFGAFDYTLFSESAICKGVSPCD